MARSRSSPRTTKCTIRYRTLHGQAVDRGRKPTRSVGVARARDVDRHFTIAGIWAWTWSAPPGPGRSWSREAASSGGAPGRARPARRGVAAADHAAVPVRQPDLRPGPDRTPVGFHLPQRDLRPEAQAPVRLLRDAGTGGGAAGRPGGTADGPAPRRAGRRGRVRGGVRRRAAGGRAAGGFGGRRARVAGGVRRR